MSLSLVVDGKTYSISLTRQNILSKQFSKTKTTYLLRELNKSVTNTLLGGNINNLIKDYLVEVGGELYNNLIYNKNKQINFNKTIDNINNLNTPNNIKKRVINYLNKQRYDLVRKYIVFGNDSLTKENVKESINEIINNKLKKENKEFIMFKNDFQKLRFKVDKRNNKVKHENVYTTKVNYNIISGVEETLTEIYKYIKYNQKDIIDLVNNEIEEANFIGELNDLLNKQLTEYHRIKLVGITPYGYKAVYTSPENFIQKIIDSLKIVTEEPDLDGSDTAVQFLLNPNFTKDLKIEIVYKDPLLHEYELKQNEFYMNFNNDIVENKTNKINPNIRPMTQEEIGRFMMREGGYFGYWNNTDIDLSRYQIFNKNRVEQYQINNVPCLAWCLYTLGVIKDFDDCKLKIIKSRDLSQICKKFNISIKLHYYTSKIEGDTYVLRKNIYKYGTSNKIIELCLYLSHYFIYDVFNENEQIQISNEKTKLYRGKIINITDTESINSKTLDLTKIHNSLQLVDALLPFYKRQNIYETKTLEEFLIPEYKPQYIEIKNKINFNEPYGYKPSFGEAPATRWYNKFNCIVTADYETVTDKEGKLIPFICNASVIDTESVMYINNETKIEDLLLNIEGKCLYDILQELPSKTLIYFHNAKFDTVFVINDPRIIKLSILYKDNIFYSMKIGIYEEGNKKMKIFEIRDSYKLLQMKLSLMNKAFNLGNTTKELCNYDIYNTDNIDLETGLLRREISIDEYINNITESGEKVNITKEEFMNNLELLGLDKNNFNMIEYYSKYCMIDCIVLMKSLLKFYLQVKDISNDINYELFDYLTIPSFAHNYFISEGCYEGVSMVGGKHREYLQQAVIGGRTRCSIYNDLRSVEGMIYDFDGVSLYPSAIARIKGCPLGTLQKIIDFDETYSSGNYYVCRIKITSCDKINYSIPCLYYSKTWVNYVEPNTVLHLDKITLEDYELLYNIKYEFIDGYYFEGYNTLFPEKIKHVFNTRKELKQNKNPLENIYKLIMNSAYGKTIMKAGDSVYKFKKVDHEFNIYESMTTKEIIPLNGVVNENGEEQLQVMVESESSSLIHTSIPQVGAYILSMSKRIMNEIIYVAHHYVSEKMILYQDTDSYHILGQYYDELVSKYNECVINKIIKKDIDENNNLIGKDLGQFHIDFSAEGRDSNNLYSKKFIGVAPKIYCDVLGDTTDPKWSGIHFRCKGVPERSILSKVLEVYGEVTPENIYKLYTSNKKVCFDLLKGNAGLNINLKSFTISKLNEFTRDIEFNIKVNMNREESIRQEVINKGKEGYCKKYFTQDEYDNEVKIDNEEYHTDEEVPFNNVISEDMIINIEDEIEGEELDNNDLEGDLALF